MHYPDIVLVTHDPGTARLPLAEPILDGNDATARGRHHPVGSGATDGQQINAPGRTVRSEVPEHLYVRPVGKWKAINAATLRGRTHLVGMHRPPEQETKHQRDNGENAVV